MSKARTLANLISDNAELADGQISVAEVVGAAPLANPSFTGNITVSGNVDGRDIAADGTKLDGVEASADVTDAANVTAAGALMDSELTNIAAIKALNQGVATTDEVAFDNTTLNAIAKDISDTAVDVFVYDTSKDSDGGAWRKRTQHTSWYNEAASSTRGARKEFPAVAVIVAESNQVTIYDGDDPDMPMWMVFDKNAEDMLGGANPSGGSWLSGVEAVNGNISVSSESGYAPHLFNVNFISEIGNMWHYADGKYRYKGNISTRNDADGFYVEDSSASLVFLYCRDVAITVLPNAPIDSVTGLPVPTIAVATDGGVSVIKDDGTVVDITAGAGSNYNGVSWIDITENYNLIFEQDSSSNPRAVFCIPIPTADRTTQTSDGNITDKVIMKFYANGSHVPYPCFNGGGVVDAIGMAGDNQALRSQPGDLTLLEPNLADPEQGKVAYIASDYNTGWMNGDIKLATLSDTDDTNVTGSELVSNGLFSNGGDWSFGGGWNFANGQAEIDSNNNDLLSQNIGMVSGKTYTVTFYVTQYTDGYVSVRLGGTEIGTATATGFYAFTGVAAGSTLQIYGFTNPTLAVDDVSVRLAEEDRSVNGKGLQVFGTVTKTAVATGADLVAYSGFSASNYLQQPVNTDIQNTNPRAFVCWVKSTRQASGYQYLWTLTNDSNYHYGLAIFQGTSGDGGKLYTYDQEHGLSVSSYMVADGSWHCVFFTDDEVDKKIYVDGNLVHTVNHGYDLNSANKQAMKLRIGTYSNGGNPMNIGSLSLLRVSGNIPSQEQIKKIYEDEKHLFQENAKATLYGSSDAVTALAYDDDTELLHAGTSAGRSVFQGLRRIDNTTDAVSVAISASNGMVAED